jgi:hypothetical protein
MAFFHPGDFKSFTYLDRTIEPLHAVARVFGTGDFAVELLCYDFLTLADYSAVGSLFPVSLQRSSKDCACTSRS